LTSIDFPSWLTVYFTGGSCKHYYSSCCARDAAEDDSAAHVERVALHHDHLVRLHWHVSARTDGVADIGIWDGRRIGSAAALSETPDHFS
jgi:hypothetical protein